MSGSARLGFRARLARTVLAGLAIVAAASPAGASAHALLHASAPSAGAVLGAGPESVLLTFSEAPDLRLTAIKVLDSSGTDHVSGALGAVTDPPFSVRAPVGPLPDGAYTVSWRAVSAVDGHVSAGSFGFGVGVAPPSAAPESGDAAAGVSESGSPPAIAARWLLYLGFVALIGAAFVAVAIARRPAPDLLAMAAIGWVLVAVGTAGVVAVQWAETGAPIETLPSTSVGLAALARVVSLALAALSLGLLGVTKTAAAAARAWLGVLAAGALVLVVDVVTGHAAAGVAAPAAIGIQAIHGFAAAAWVGGLGGVLVVLRSTPPDERLGIARRFSTWAGIALAGVAMTGLFRAIDEIGSFGAFLTTDFGRIVVVKTALLAVLAALGAVNRFVNLPNPARFTRAFGRIGGGEIAAAIAIIGLSALLVNLTPPASATGSTAPPPRPIVAVGNDFGTSLKLRLVASPGTVGTNQLDVAVLDYDTGEPVDASAVALKLELKSRAGVAPATVDLVRTTAGHFAASSPALSIDGIWQITATVTVSRGATDVPLVVATVVPAQPVSENVSPGLPTISTVQLGVAGSAQLYLDPGASGTNDVHVTFFDPDGGALPVEAVTMAITDAAGAGQLLSPRRLDVGHFVASANVRAGPVSVDVVGPLPASAGGSQVHVHVTIEVQP